MDEPTFSLARRIAQVVSAFERRRAGIAPVHFTEETRAITSHGTLSPPRTPLDNGAASLLHLARGKFETQRSATTVILSSGLV